MKLMRLHIRRLPGIEEPFELGPELLSGSLQIIHGPNGSGKSSLCRAVRALLWPDTLPDEGVAVEATFSINGAVWFARREGQHVAWQRDGATTEPPALPPRELANSFLVSIEEVTRLETSEFTSRIRRELSGGIDFQKLAEEWAWSERAAKDEAGRHRDARKTLDAREQRLRELDAEAESLGTIEQSLETAQALQSESPVLEKLLDLVDAQQELRALTAQISSYPKGMERLRDDEAERLESVERELRSAEAAVQSGKRKIEEQIRVADDVGLETPVADQELATLEALVAKWEEAERGASQGQITLAKARAAEASAAKRCPPGAKADALLNTANVPAAKLDRLVRTGARLEEQQKLLEGELGRLPATGTGPEPERMSNAANALRSWLAEPTSAAGGASPLLWALVIVAALGLAAAGALASPVYFVVAAIVVVLGVVIASRARPAESGRAAYEKQYAAQELGAVKWTREAVQRRLGELDAEAGQARERDRIEQRRRELKQQLAELATQLQEQTALRDDLRTALGIDVLATDFELQGFAHAVQALRDACAEVEQERKGCELLFGMQERAAGNVRGAIAAYDASPIGSPQDARGFVGALRSQSLALRGARMDLERARTGLADAEAVLERARSASMAFWAALDLPEGGETELHARLNRLAEWTEHERRANELGLRAAVLREKLGVRSADAEQGREELVRRKQEADAGAAKRDELSTQRGEILGRLRDARQSNALESARADLDARRAQLVVHYDEARKRRLGSLLLTEIREEYEQRSQPLVLKRADEGLRRFTHGRYGVRGEPDGNLRILDLTRAGSGLAPAQLSTGTRAQLFLALRQAFAESVSHTERPPLFLDDALATSDIERIGAVGAALRDGALAEGWQVFYLTTDPANARLLAGDDLRGVDVIDLAALRKLQRGSLARERLAELTPAAVPSPDGLDADEYGALLCVPPIDPYAGVEALHPFYVLRNDLPGLQRVLEAHIEHVGALDTMLALRPDLLDAESSARTLVWIAVARSVLDAWRMGRGKPVVRDVLAHGDSGVTDSFLDRVTVIAAEHGGDARKLLVELEARTHPKAKGFRGDARVQLQEYLERRGYYDPQPQLDRDQAWMRVLAESFGGQHLETATLRARFEWLWGLLETRV